MSQDSPTTHVPTSANGLPPGISPEHAPNDAAETAHERRDADTRRASVVDRRIEPTGLERRRGPGRRRSDFVKAAEEGQMTNEQFLFVAAIDAYKHVNHVPFPAWSQVLEVMRRLGYRKTCASTLNLPNCEDWTEAPDAPVFPPPPAAEPGARATPPDEKD